MFVPIVPCRLADTRSGDNSVGPRKAPLGATEAVTVTAHGDNGECTGASSIPNEATALAMNVTALGATSPTFLTFWGDGDNPGTANLNPSPGQPPTPNVVNTPLSAAGTFTVYNDAGSVHVVIDVNGYYAPHDHDDRYPLIDDVYMKDELYTKDDLYTQDQLYTQDEVDDLLDAMQPDEIVLGPTAFTVVDPVTSKWKPGYTLFHGASPDIECVNANVPLTPGRRLDDVVVVMSAANGGTLNIDMAATRSTPGLLDASVFVDVPVSDIPVGPIAGETSAFDVFFGNTHVVLDDYVYMIKLCTDDLMEVHAIEFTYS